MFIWFRAKDGKLTFGNVFEVDEYGDDGRPIFKIDPCPAAEDRAGCAQILLFMHELATDETSEFYRLNAPARRMGRLDIFIALIDELEANGTLTDRTSEKLREITRQEIDEIRRDCQMDAEPKM